MWHPLSSLKMKIVSVGPFTNNVELKVVLISNTLITPFPNYHHLHSTDQKLPKVNSESEQLKVRKQETARETLLCGGGEPRHILRYTHA